MWGHTALVDVHQGVGPVPCHTREIPPTLTATRTMALCLLVGWHTAGTCACVVMRVWAERVADPGATSGSHTWPRALLAPIGIAHVRTLPRITGSAPFVALLHAERASPTAIASVDGRPNRQSRKESWLLHVGWDGGLLS